MHRQTNMKDLLIKFDDLPDEILIYIFKKMSNDQVLYSLMGVNQRLNRIVHDTSFTRHLSLLEYRSVDDSIFPLPEPILDRFCSKILPEIGHQIVTLYLERTSIERVLHAANYPNLINLGLCNVELKLRDYSDDGFYRAMSLFHDEYPLTHTFKNQISSLFINFKRNNSVPIGIISQHILRKVLSAFTNLRCLTFNPSSSDEDAVYFNGSNGIVISSTLLEFHVSLIDMDACLYVLDGCFDRLRILYVAVSSISPSFYSVLHDQNLLPNLQIFSLCCKEKINKFDKSIVPLLHRMLNLEELDLNIIVECYENFIDGDTLKKDIIMYMPRLSKFTFNIWSTINHRNQTNFPLNEHIQKTLEYISDNQITTSIDHFEEEGYSQCHIYSYPYKWNFYYNITNNFRGGLFPSVTEVSLYDEHPFEHEFFLRIQKSFPFMKKLTIKNRKAQNNKEFIKSNNDNQMLSIMEYSNLTRLDLMHAHDDYVELVLFDTKISLPNNPHLCVGYQSVKRVTHNFTRCTTRNNCPKLAALYLDRVNEIDEHIKNYFPHTCIHSASAFF